MKIRNKGFSLNAIQEMMVSLPPVENDVIEKDVVEND